MLTIIIRLGTEAWYVTIKPRNISNETGGLASTGSKSGPAQLLTSLSTAAGLLRSILSVVTFGRPVNEQQVDERCACVVAHHCDSARVAAKRRYVVSHPLQSCQDVAHAQVPRIRSLAVRPRARAQEPCNTVTRVRVEVVRSRGFG